jgi:hypothetical protein
MQTNAITPRNVIVVSGGTAGWMIANDLTQILIHSIHTAHHNHQTHKAEC